MSIWRSYPTLYEINTWVWLNDLAAKTGTFVDLNSVSSAEWDAIAELGFDGVWLMGVWERSPAGIAIANRNENLLADFRRALPDFRPEDNVDRLTAFAATRWISTSEAAKALLGRARNLRNAGCGCFSISFPIMWRPIIRG